jgi:protein-export membrane protein SecD
MKYSNKILWIVITTLLLGVFAMPQSWKELLPDSQVKTILLDKKLHLGLDLQGGAQLDYLLDLRQVEKYNNDEDPSNDLIVDQIVEGVRTTIERRVNGLGVSEPNIYTADIADERHIIVELAGVKDLQVAKEQVGKTIQLQFKEQKQEIDPNEKNKIQEEAQKTLDTILNSNNFSETGDKVQTNDLKIQFQEYKQFKEEITEKIRDILWNLKEGEVHSQVIEISDGYAINEFQQVSEITGFTMFKAGKKQLEEREITIDAEEFAVVAKEISENFEDTNASLDTFPPELRTSIEELNPNEVSDILETDNAYFLYKLIKRISPETIETLETTEESESPTIKTEEFPKETLFHIEKIRINKDTENAKLSIETLKKRVTDSKKTVQEEQLSYERIFYSTVPDPWKTTGLDGDKFKRATVVWDQIGRPLISIEFNEEGAKLFEEITERNIGKPLAIFVGGILISSPNVSEKISGGSAQITGSFTIPEAAQLAQDLQTGAIPAPIILVGQHQVGASLGEQALNSSILAGFIGLILLAIYMIFQYRLFGLIANMALIIYAIILIFILKTSSVIGFSIILTLAGMAGIILSIGMAVDANILIFERIKEELQDGKKIPAAIAIGFERAWTSIADSNISSLITCAILFSFGSSIIRGFAINLGIGIMVSMFTAMFITKYFLYFFFHNWEKDKQLLLPYKK